MRHQRTFRRAGGTGRQGQEERLVALAHERHGARKRFDAAPPGRVERDGADAMDRRIAVRHQHEMRTEMACEPALLLRRPAHVHRQDDRAEPRDGHQRHYMIGVVAERETDHVAGPHTDRGEMPGGVHDKLGKFRVADGAGAIDDRRMGASSPRIVEDPVGDVEPTVRIGNGDITNIHRVFRTTKQTAFRPICLARLDVVHQQKAMSCLARRDP